MIRIDQDRRLSVKFDHYTTKNMQIICNLRLKTG